MVTYNEEFHLIKLHDPSITRMIHLIKSCDKLNISYLILHTPISTNLARWCFTMRGFHPYSNITLKTCAHVRSCDKLKTYLYFHNVYGQQTCQVGDLLRGTLTHKFVWPLNEAVLLTYHERLPPLKPHDPLITWAAWYYVTISKICIITFTRLMATKLGRALTLGRRFSTQMQMLKSSPTSCFYVIGNAIICSV